MRFKLLFYILLVRQEICEVKKKRSSIA
ncbi:hypothetical protein [Sulfurisphaera tokodaii]